jgi:tetratricopeptide (TPR) repeat protein
MKQIFYSIVVLSFFLGSCQKQNEESKKTFAAAVNLFYNNKHSEAKNLFSKCIEAKYNLSESYYYRGSARFNLKDYTGAVEDMSLAIAADTLNMEAYSTRGDIYAILGKKDEGCKDWRKARELGKPNMGDKIKYCR